jgi:hypothetical protein
MSKKRITIKPKGNSRTEEQEAKVYPSTYTKRGVEYFCYMVRGWKADGVWQRKQFKDQAKAEAYAHSVNINLRNEGQQRMLIHTSMNEEQVNQAEKAYRTLGDTYSMNEVVDFFLKHNRPPEFTINILDGLKLYVDEKEREGVRATTLKKTKMIIKAFADATDNQLIHKVTEADIKSYLNSRRAKDGISAAKKKTFNNHRNELSSFFKWAGKTDLSTNRPWTFNNPTDNIPAFSNKRVAEQRPDIATSSPEITRELLSYVMNYKGGKLAKWFALAYFTGIRPSTDEGELVKLSRREDELINMTTGTIMLPANMTKTKDSRQVTISENLRLWLEAYEGMPIAPVNLKNDYAHVRKKFNLQSDETRHSFISYHVALNRSIGDTALESGNTESIIKKHYLSHHSQEDGEQFFSIIPDIQTGETVFSANVVNTNSNLRVI